MWLNRYKRQLGYLSQGTLEGKVLSLKTLSGASCSPHSQPLPVFESTLLGRMCVRWGYRTLPFQPKEEFQASPFVFPSWEPAKGPQRDPVLLPQMAA